ncbi:MAG: alanine racemase [Pseudomonadota bacterium]
MRLDDDQLVTPCLVLDRSRLARNAKRFRAQFADMPVQLRPHLKTVKSIAAARMVLPDMAGPATVSTLREAEVFAENGVDNLLYAVGMAPGKLSRASDLIGQGVKLTVITDNVRMAQQIVAQSLACGHPMPTLIEVDVDGHRAGVPLHDAERLLAVAEVLSAGNCLEGVMTHAGGSYELNGADAIQRCAEAERHGAVAMAAILREHGYACPTVSIGSTPTAFGLSTSEGITEVRAGVYTFFDLFQAGVGVCSIEDIAISVLTTVIGHQAERGWIIVDGGWMALSADRSTASQALDQGFGLVCDCDGNVYQDLIVAKANQEHGIITLRSGAQQTLPDLPVGTRLRILPNHACATAAQHEGYQVIDEDLQITAFWPRISGW